MEVATFRTWLSDRGCTFESGRNTIKVKGHACVTVRRDGRRAVLPDVGTKQRLDPGLVRQIVEEPGLDWNEPPGPASRA
jgi:hypothetical protein